jgi:hypothetical protein
MEVVFISLGGIGRHRTVIDENVLEQRIFFPRELRVPFPLFENPTSELLSFPHDQIERVLGFGKWDGVAFHGVFLLLQKV